MHSLFRSTIRFGPVLAFGALALGLAGPLDAAAQDGPPPLPPPLPAEEPTAPPAPPEPPGPAASGDAAGNGRPAGNGEDAAGEDAAGEDAAEGDRSAAREPGGPRPVVVAALAAEAIDPAEASAAAQAVAADLDGRAPDRPVRAAAERGTVEALAVCADEAEGAPAEGGPDSGAGTGEGDATTAAAPVDARHRCYGRVLARAGAVAGVVVHLEAATPEARPRRRDADGPWSMRLEVVDAGTGALRGEPVLLVVPGEWPQESMPAELEAALGDVARLLPPLPPQATLLVATNVDGATVEIDGEAVGSSPLPPLEVAPGSHQVRVRSQGFRPFEREVDVAQGERARIDADLRPDESTLALLEERELERSGGPPLYKNWYLWAGVGGVVVAGLVAGIAVAASGGESDPDGFPIPPIEQ